MATKKSGKTLTRSVTVINPEDGQDYTFGPDDDLPAWAEKAITNPAAFESDDDYIDDNGIYSGAARDAEHNKRGRVRRAAPEATSLGEKATPADSKDTGSAKGE